MAGLYVHFPFCRAKCRYCDFYSLPFSAARVDDYLLALLTEVESKRGQEWESFDSIYLGGGTPSLMDPGGLATLLSTLRRCFQIQPDAEITLEANPGTINRDKLSGFLAAGVNRVSLGAQSFQDRELALLGRIHRAAEVKDAVALLRDLHCANFNLDLIFGIPGQSLQTWQETLEQALELEPQHISCYLLQLDPETPLAVAIARKEIIEPDEDTESDMYYAAIDRLTAAGLEHYEISNFARPGFACRHNLNYWRSGQYLGLGPGSVTCKDRRRCRNLADLDGYIGQLSAGCDPPAQVDDILDPRQWAAERLILGLRMTGGIDLEEVAAILDTPDGANFAPGLEWGRKEGLLEVVPPRIRLSRSGYFLSNLVLRELV